MIRITVTIGTNANGAVQVRMDGKSDKEVPAEEISVADTITTTIKAALEALAEKEKKQNDQV